MSVTADVAKIKEDLKDIKDELSEKLNNLETMILENRKTIEESFSIMNEYINQHKSKDIHKEINDTKDCLKNLQNLLENQSEKIFQEEGDIIGKLSNELYKFEKLNSEKGKSIIQYPNIQQEIIISKPKRTFTLEMPRRFI
jgi:flagellar motility protein MotE (MotC chaperone)